MASSKKEAAGRQRTLSSSSSAQGRSFSSSADFGGESDDNVKRQIFAAVRADDLEALQQLLLSEAADSGRVSLGSVDKFGRTALHIAASGADADMLRFLVEQGMGVDMQDRRLNTPLHLAAKSNSHEIVSLLLGFGADALAKNSEGHTPLSLAQIKARSKIVKILRQHIAEITATPKAPSAPRLLRRSPTSLTVGWMVPKQSGAGEYPVTSYDLRFSLRGVFTPWITRVGYVDCGPIEIENLAAGKDYVMQVRARNKNGPGPYSAKSSTMTTGETEVMQENTMVFSGSKDIAVSQSPSLSNPGDEDLMINHLGRSDSYRTMEDQRNHAEERMKKLASERSLAEQAMLRIDRECEEISQKLVESRKEAKKLRDEGFEKDAIIASLRQKVEVLEEEKTSKKGSENLSNASPEAIKLNQWELKIEALEQDIIQWKANATAAERRAQTSEERRSLSEKHAEAAVRARCIAEKDAHEARNQRDVAEKNSQAERDSRVEAEAHAAQLGALVGKLQRQRDAAEAIATQLETMSNGTNNSKGSAETIVQLQDALKSSNQRVFELAGVEQKFEMLQTKYAATLQNLDEMEESVRISNAKVKELKNQNQSLRSQRDDTEKDAEVARQARVEAESALHDLKHSYEALLSLQEEHRNNNAKSISEEEKTQSYDAIEAIDAKWKDIVNSSADEMFLLMSDMRAHIEKIESIENVMSGGQKVPTSTISIEDVVEDDIYDSDQG